MIQPVPAHPMVEAAMPANRTNAMKTSVFLHGRRVCQTSESLWSQLQRLAQPSPARAEVGWICGIIRFA